MHTTQYLRSAPPPVATPLDGLGLRVDTRLTCNCSVKPWKSGPSASSPQRSRHIASVSPLSHQRGGWTTPRTGQPRVLASRETPLHGWRTDHIVRTPRVSSPLSAPSPDGGGRGTLRRLLGRHRGQTRRRSSRGVHPPSGGGVASRTGGSPAIAGTSNLVRVQAITA